MTTHPTRIVLVRHAESVPPGPGFEDEFTRPLTAQGVVDSEALRNRLLEFQPSAVLSSPYLRAVQTVEPVARVLGQEVQLVMDFREHRMASQPISNWREVLHQQWLDFGLAQSGGETMASTQQRGWTVLVELATKNAGKSVILAGHGTIIALMLHRLDPSIGFEFHLAMPNPAVYVVEQDGPHWRWNQHVQPNLL